MSKYRKRIARFGGRVSPWPYVALSMLMAVLLASVNLVIAIAHWPQ